MILSDKQIKELCVPPPFMVTKRYVHSTNMSLNYSDKEEFSYGPFEKLNAAALDYSSQYGIRSGLVSFRETTPEEKAAFRPMVSPYIDHQIKQDDNGNKIISAGQSSYGYDIRITDEFKIFTNINSTVVNPKDFDNRSYTDFRGPVCIIPPNSFVLARSLEYFKMPEDMTGIVFSKSTYARCGIACFTTVIEAGWEGELVLEFSNTTSLPAMLFANEGAAQIVFLQGDHNCEVSYLTRNGKYQGQTGITLPKV